MSNYQQQIDKLEERIVDLEDELYETRKLLTDLTAAMSLMTDRITEHGKLFDGIYQIQNRTTTILESLTRK